MREERSFSERVPVTQRKIGGISKFGPAANLAQPIATRSWPDFLQSLLSLLVVTANDPYGRSVIKRSLAAWSKSLPTTVEGRQALASTEALVRSSGMAASLQDLWTWYDGEPRTT